MKSSRDKNAVDPFLLFMEWYQEELKRSTLQIPSACCLSTIGLDGYPNARFLALKELKNENFILTGPLTSRKGQEILRSDKVALTFWWSTTGKQIRIQGNANFISAAEADSYFKDRNRESQLVSTVSDQGKEMEDIELLNENFKKLEEELNGDAIQRPANWGGIAIVPKRIEFLEFKESRFHDRLLFLKTNNGWNKTLLQP